jgi:20S proteasome alpha/beta subunit
MVVILSIFLFLLHSSQAAHSRRRVVVTRSDTSSFYDREITTFNPQGRLEQVEYGMMASQRGGSIGALKCNNTLYLLVERPFSSSTSSSSTWGTSIDKVHRIDDNKFLLTTGLVGDGRWLAQQLRISCQQHGIDFGEVATVQETAVMAADLYHSMTRMGGVRPLGCHAIIVGVDENISTNHPALVEDNTNQPLQHKVVRIFQSDPGGGMEECHQCVAAGQRKDNLYKELFKLSQQQIEKAEDSATVAQKLIQLMFRLQRQDKGALTKHPDSSMIDLWTIQPKHGRRGDMLATVYTNIDKQVNIKGKMGRGVEQN